MPHIVIEKAATLACYAVDFAPISEREDKTILKVQDLYLNCRQSSGLLESVVVEDGQSQTFFIHLAQKDTSTTVRLWPQTDPEKTPGVKKLLAIVAHGLKECSPDSVYGKTNLQEFLIAPSEASTS